MTDRKISNFEFATINYFLTRAFLIGFTFNTLLRIIRQDSWIIPLISIMPALILIYLINYIINYEPDLNISEKIIKLFNKKIGIIILSILTIFICILSTLNYLNLNNFIQSQFLSRTPLIFISVMFMISTFYILHKGINTMTRTSNILFYFGFVLLILSFLGLLPVLKIDNLKPFLTYSPINYINGLNSFYVFNILPMFLLTIIPKNKITNPKIKKFLIVSYIVSAISIFLIIFQTISTFGYELSVLYEYAEFFALKHVILIELASRIESILVIQLILDIFIFNVFSIYFIGNSIKTIINIKKNTIVYLILCSLIIIGAIFLSKYNMLVGNIIEALITNITSIFLSFIIILICIKIKIDKH